MNYTYVTDIKLHPLSQHAGWELQSPKWLSCRKRVGHSGRGGSVISESQVLKAAACDISISSPPSLIVCETHIRCSGLWFQHQSTYPLRCKLMYLFLAWCLLISWTLKLIKEKKNKCWEYWDPFLLPSRKYGTLWVDWVLGPDSVAFILARKWQNTGYQIFQMPEPCQNIKSQTAVVCPHLYQPRGQFILLSF